MSVKLEELIVGIANEIRYKANVAEGYGIVERDKISNDIDLLKKKKLALQMEIKNLDAAVRIKTEWCERNGMVLCK